MLHEESDLFVYCTCFVALVVVVDCSVTVLLFEK